MKQYDSYKDSGIEWIGEIPSHWEVKRLKRLAKIGNGQDHKNVWDENGEYPIIGTGGIFGRANKYLYGGPSVILGRKGTIDKPQFVESPFWSVDTAYYTEIFQDVNPKLFYYLCTTINFELHKYGSAVPSMTQEVLNQIPFVIASSLQEQTTIAHYLDRKTTEIDQLIAHKKRLLTLYEEEKTALINQAVTKGLDPNVPMKNSGIEWLGEIPEHWEVKRLRYCCQILRGKFTHRPRNDERLYGGNYPFIQTGEIARAEKYITCYTQTLNELGYAVSNEFPSGTLLMTIAANIGEVAILEFDACFPDSIVGFYPKQEIDNEFLYYKLKSMKEVFLSTSVLNTQLNLNIERIREVDLNFPSIQEQQSIVCHIETECARIDAKVAKTEKLINLLEEYRTALISEVVTGKVKVV